MPREENKWKSLKSFFLAERDYNEAIGKNGQHKIFDYDKEVREILGERPNVHPLGTESPKARQYFCPCH